jgi:hypothetical protein
VTDRKERCTGHSFLLKNRDVESAFKIGTNWQKVLNKS